MRCLCLLSLWLCLPLRAANITLAWLPVPDAVTGYTLRYGTNSGVYMWQQAITNMVAGQVITRATVEDLVPGVPYYFSVAAFNAVGDGPLSGEVSYTPYGITGPVPLLPVVGLRFLAITTNSATLGWQPGIHGPVAYMVLGGTNTGEYNLVQVVDAPTTAITAIDLVPGVRYYFAARELGGVAPNYTLGPLSGELVFGDRPRAPVVTTFRAGP